MSSFVSMERNAEAESTEIEFIASSLLNELPSAPIIITSIAYGSNYFIRDLLQFYLFDIPPPLL